jgi:nucleotide sugar dehydrogenase
MQHPHSFMTLPPEQDGAVAVIGLGKIGLPLAIQYVSHGRRVIGCDINPEVVGGINAGGCHVHEEPGLEDLVERAVAEARLSATTDTTAGVGQAAVVVVIPPVIVTPAHEVDFRSIDAATRAVGAGLKPGTLVIYETTLPTGTTSGRLRQILEEQSGLVAGSDFLLAYSPERVSSGSIFRDLATYPKVVGGINEASRDAAGAFYRSVLDAEIMLMASADEAEFVKLIETTYRDVNIALANEYARYADAHGLDAVAAIAAANTQPYSHIHSPGVGVGGHCIPVYPYFLLHGTTEGLTLPREARVINDAMAHYTIERIEAEIGALAGKAVLLLGVAYRGNVREVAFTSAKLLQEALLAHGASVFADDPLFSAQELETLGYQPFQREQRGEIHTIILQAGHESYRELDFSQFTACQLVLDGRRALNPAAIAAAGMRYLSIGDGQKPLVPVR